MLYLYIFYILYILICPVKGSQETLETGLSDSTKSIQPSQSNEAKIAEDAPGVEEQKPATSTYSRSRSGTYSSDSREKSSPPLSPREKVSLKIETISSGEGKTSEKPPLSLTKLTPLQPLSDSKKRNSSHNSPREELPEIKKDNLQIPSLDLKSILKHSGRRRSPSTSPHRYAPALSTHSHSSSHSSTSKEKNSPYHTPREKVFPKTEPLPIEEGKQTVGVSLNLEKLTSLKESSNFKKSNSPLNSPRKELFETKQGHLQVPSLDLKSTLKHSKSSEGKRSPHTSPRRQGPDQTTIRFLEEESIKISPSNEFRFPLDISATQLKNLSGPTHSRSRSGSHSSHSKGKRSHHNSPRGRVSDQNNLPSQEKKSIKILALDGGGIRGIIPALFLRELEAVTNKKIIDLFDVFAGTSTGGLIALGLTFPDSPGSTRPKYDCQEFVKLYQELSPKIFTKNRAWWGSQYSAKGLEEVLTDYFGQSFLSEALKPVLVTTYDIQRRKPFVLSSHFCEDDSNLLWQNRDFRVIDAARATSAAPTYFPPVKVSSYTKSTHEKENEQEYHFIDGGLVANNPALEALAYAKQNFPKASEYVVVSVGTGYKEKSISYESARGWGRFSWVRPIIEITTGGAPQERDQLLDLLSPSLGVHRFRFNTSLKQASGLLDDISPQNINDLIEEATKLFKNMGNYTE